MATQSTRTRRLERDTGFPEPFDANRNTTLPHPDADLSPNAFITHDESAGDMMVQQRRRPTGLLHRAKTRQMAKDTILESPAEVFASFQPAAAAPPAAAARPESRSHAIHHTFTRSSSTTLSIRGDGESVMGRDDEATPPTSPESIRSTTRKRSFVMSKWKR